MFASTSKITLAGAGVAFLAGSVETVKWYTGHLGKGAIGPDKVNQLRHAQFFGSPQGVRDHMVKHRAIIAPKFAEVERILSERLGGLGRRDLDQADAAATSSASTSSTAPRRGWSSWPRRPASPSRPAGASFPHGDDPRDRNIRLAPTFPPLDQVSEAMEAVATCVLLAAAEKLRGRA